MEKYFDTGFMLIGLGFFMYVIWLVHVIDERDYQRKVNEAREFGFENSRLRKKDKIQDPTKTK